MSLNGVESDLVKKIGDLLEANGLPRDATFGQLDKHLGIERPQPYVIKAPVPSHLRPISELVKESMSEPFKPQTPKKLL